LAPLSGLHQLCPSQLNFSSFRMPDRFVTRDGLPARAEEADHPPPGDHSHANHTPNDPAIRT
jgi:hypothetical protein